MTGAAAPALSLFATAEIERTPLVVSVHDVAPSTRQASKRIVTELTRHGVRVCSLLVVPNYHRTGRAVEDRDFLQWLRDLEAVGHEIVIHGYFHQRPPRAHESLSEQFITRTYTRGEGEFYDLDYEEALQRITRARDEFIAAGLKPRGFIAPAWLLSKEAERAATDAEMEYTTGLTSVRDLRTGRNFSSRSLVYSTRNSWRRAASLAWNGALARLLSDSPLIRLGLHPPDLGHAAVWAQITRLVEQFAESRNPTTYRDWIAEQRLSRTDEQ